MDTERRGGCYSPARYIPPSEFKKLAAIAPTHTEILDGVVDFLNDAFEGDGDIRRLRGKVWFTLDGQVFEVKAIHKA